LIAGVSLLLACPAFAEMMHLDFGDGALREGWERVTAADQRWSGGKVFEEHVAFPDYEKLMREDKHLRVYPNQLTCDFAGGLHEATFTVKAPEGTSRCWILLGFGDDRYNPERPWYFDTRVAINGQARETVRLTARALFEQRTFDCAPRDGKLSLTFSTDRVQWMVAAMILYGDADQKEVVKEIAAITEQIEFLPPALASRWKLRPRLEKETLATLTDDEIEKGCVIFHRNYVSEVYPDSRPTRREIDAGVTAFATPGEFEPLTFSVYPLRDMRVKSVEAQLPDATLRIDRVVCQRVKEGGYNSAISGWYRVEPSYLRPIDSRGVHLKKDGPLRIWITAHVDKNAPPGVKEGEATVTFDDGTVCRAPISLEVLPFRLEKDPEITYGVYYLPRLWFFGNSNWMGHPRRKELARITHEETVRILADMADHGMNAASAPVAWTVADGKPVVSASARSDAIFSLYREYGLDRLAVWTRMHTDMARAVKESGCKSFSKRWKGVPKDIESPQFYAFLKDLVRAVQAQGKESGWPQIVYAPIDEPSSREANAFAKLANTAIKEVGARTYCTMKWFATKDFSPMVDIRCYGTGFRPGNKKSETNWPEDGRAENTRTEQEFWVYPNVLTAGSGVSPAFGRFWYGFYGWRIGLQGYFPCRHTNSWGGNLFNDFDGYGGRFILPGPDGPLPTVAYEGMREGIDDMRYIYTLEQFIERAPDAARADEAKTLLAQLRENVPAYRDWALGYAHRGIPTSSMLDDPEMRKMWEPLRPPKWPPAKMQEYRKRIADTIVHLASQEQ